MPHPRKILPSLSPTGSFLFSLLFCFVSFSASAVTCISTDNGSLNDPAIFGKYQNSHQDPACGKDFTLNYTVAFGTEVNWGDNKTLSGTLVNQGTFNIQAPGVFEGELENEGILNLQAPVVFESLLSNKATLKIKSGISGEVEFQGGLVNQGTFAANHNPDATVHWQGSTRLESGSVELNGVSLKISGDVQESGDNFSVQSSNLELSGRTVWMVPRSLTFSKLSLHGNTLLLGDNATELQLSNKVTMAQASEQIILGLGSLGLLGGLELQKGYLSVGEGALLLGGTSLVETEGLLDLSGGNLDLESSGTLTVQGTLRMNSNADLTNASSIQFQNGTLEGSGSLVLDHISFGGKSRIRLLEDTEIISANALALETIEFQQNHLRLNSETTDLTLDHLTLNALGENGFDTGLADLTVNGSVDVQSGRLASSGGILDFSGSVQFDPSFSVLELDNTSLNLSELFQLSSVLRFGGTSSLPANDLLDLSGASIELGGNLNLVEIHTDNTTFIELKDNSSISSQGEVMLGRLMTHGYSLELGSANTDLNLLGIGEPTQTPEERDLDSSFNMSPVIESLIAERLQDGSLKWSAVISDDSPFSTLTTRWEYLFGAPREFRTPSYIPAADSQSGTVEVVMSDYDDSDGGLLLLTVCDQAIDHQGDCDSQHEGATSISFELIPYAYQLPLICDGTDCSQPITDVPDMPSNPGEVESLPSGEDNLSSTITGGKILLNGGTLKIQESLILDRDQIETEGGRLVLQKGAVLNQGATLKLDNGTLELGNNLTLVDSNLQSAQGRLKLLDNVSLIIPDAVSFREIQLQQKTLALDSSVTSLTVTEQLLIDHAEAGIIRNRAEMVFKGGVRIDQGSKLSLDNQSQIQPGNIILNGGNLEVYGPPNTDTSALPTGVSVLRPSTVKIAPGVLFISDNLSLQDSFTIHFESSESRFETGSLFLVNESSLTGNGTSKLLLQNLFFNEQNEDRLILNNITIEINNCISNTERARIDETNGTFVMSSALEITDDSYQLTSDLQCPIKLNNAKICVTETAAIFGEMTFLGNVDIHIAPGKMMTYGGVNPIQLNSRQLSILGGGRFFTDKQHSNGIQLNDVTSKLVLADQGTTVSHLKATENGQGSKIQIRSNYAGGTNGDFSCEAFAQNDLDNVTIENFVAEGNAIFEMEAPISLKLEKTVQVADNQTLEITEIPEVSGAGEVNLVLGEKLELSGTLKLNHPSRLIGGSIEINEGRLEVSHDSSIDSSITLQNQGGTISLDAEKSLRLETSIMIANAQKLTLEGGSNAKLELENTSQFLNQGILELDAENLILEGGSLDVSGEGKTIVLKSATLKNTFLNLSQTALEGSQVFSVEVLENVEFRVDNSSVQLNQSEIQVETGGSLEFDNSTVEWQGQLSKSGAGSLKFDEVHLKGNASYSGSTEATLNLLQLDNHTLELLSETSSLRFLERLPFSGTQSELKTNSANLVFEKGLELSSGKVSSTGGRIEVHDNLTSTGGSLDLQNSTLALDGSWKREDGTFTSSGNTLELLDNLSIFSSEELSFQNLNLAGNPLVFAEGSSTKLRIHSALSLDDPSEAIQVGDGNLTLLAPVNLNTGTLGSDGGTVRFEQGVTLNGGDLAISNSKLVIGNQLTKSGGMVNFTGTGLELLSDLSLTSDTLLSFESLDLNQQELTLLSAASGIELQSQLRMDDPNEALISGDADLKLHQGISIDEGLISSTSGTVSINASSSLTNDGTLSVSSGTLELGGDFQKIGGSLLIGDSTFKLLSDLSWTSDSLLEVSALDLNNLTLTLGSGSSDFKINNALTLDEADEKLISGPADVEFTELLSISNGELSSSGGEIRFDKGLDLSGGKVEIFNSSIIFGSEPGNEVSLVQTGTAATFDAGSSSLQLLQNLTLQSNSELVFQSLDLNSRELTLADETSDLSLNNQLILDEASEKIITGAADLKLEGGIQMSAGEITSTGGTLALSETSPNLFQNDAVLELLNTNLESAGTGESILTLDGEPNLSMNGGSIARITLERTQGTVGTISTRGGVTCIASCQGFDETGSYGFNIHGLYREVVSANWKLSEAEGERKNARISVKLLSRPLQEVSLFLSSSDVSEVTMDAYQLTFDEGNWNRLQTILLTGEDDYLADGDIRVRVIGYTDSEDAEYQSVGDWKKHAFKYIFTNLNDDIQVGLSPIAKIAPDQMINEGARVILDGSASYDPDPAGWIDRYIWTQTTTEDLTLNRADQSIANFIAPQIDVDSKGLVFQLAVQDNDGTVGYATTSITVMDTVQLAALVEGGVAPVLPKNLDYVSTENPDGSSSISVTAPTGGANQTEMKTDGSAVNRFTLPDGTTSEMNVPPGVSFNLNRDASTSVEMLLSGDATLYSQVSSTGEMSIGVSSDGKGVNVKAPSGANLEIGADGTSNIVSPPQTNEDGSVTRITTQLKPDGSLQIDLGSSGSEGSRNAKSTSEVSLSSDPGLALSVDTSNGINVSTKVGGGTLSSTIASAGTSSTSFVGSTSTTSFATSLPMNVRVRSGGTIEGTSSGKAGYDGVSRVLKSSVGSNGVTAELQGTGEQASKLISAQGSSVSYNERGVLQSTFDNGSTHSSLASVNSEGIIDTRITRISDNSKLILPRVSQGATVRQQADRISINVPLSHYLTGRQGGRNTRNSNPESRFSNRSGVYSQYPITGFWVGWDSRSGKPVYVEPLGADAELLIENTFDNQSAISLASGSAKIRIGDSYGQTLNSRSTNATESSLNVSSVPSKVALNGPRNLIAMPAYLTIQPSDFEFRFGDYKTVWVYRNQTWLFFTTDTSLKPGYLEKGYRELTESIEPGEGFWVELKPPANPTNFEMEFRGSYRMLPQFSFTRDEWSLAGAAEKISVEDITKAANFDQSSEDDDNSLGFFDGSGGIPPGTMIGMLETNIPFSRKTLLFFGFASLLWFFTLHLRWSASGTSVLRKRALQAVVVSGLLFGLAACAPPQSDSSKSTIPYSGSKDRMHSIWKWDSSNSTWKAYSPKDSVAAELENQGYSTFSEVEPGEGFWVRISQSNVPESMAFSQPPAF